MKREADMPVAEPKKKTAQKKTISDKKATKIATARPELEKTYTNGTTFTKASTNPIDPKLTEALKKQFGFATFKGEQAHIIQSLLDGKHTSGIMPTGGGKSLPYQRPAIMSEGTAIIISPLIALMKTQVDALRSYSDRDQVAHFLNSSLTKAQAKVVRTDIRSGKSKMVFIAPET